MQTIGMGTFENVLRTLDTSALSPEVFAHKFYVPGIGPIAEQ